MKYLLTFFEGILAFISPCMLPMVPILIAYLVGENNDNKKKLISNILLFILGFTIVFTLLGLFAGTFGRFVGKYLMYINVVFGILLIIMGLNYAQIISIRILNKSSNIIINEKNNSKKDKKYKNEYIHSIIFGIFFALTWSPCLGTYLTLALTKASNTKNAVSGALMLSIYSLGIGLPFLFAGLFMSKLKNTFSYIKKNYNIIIKISGILLIIMGIYIEMKSLINIWRYAE